MKHQLKTPAPERYAFVDAGTANARLAPSKDGPWIAAHNYDDAQTEITRLTNLVIAATKAEADLRITLSETRGRHEVQWKLKNEQIDALEIECRKLRNDMTAANLRRDEAKSLMSSLYPGLMLDLRYANADDDKDALYSRIVTVEKALAALAIQAATIPPHGGSGDL